MLSRAHCVPDATFAAQAGALADVKTLQQYTRACKVVGVGPLLG